MPLDALVILDPVRPIVGSGPLLEIDGGDGDPVSVTPTGTAAHVQWNDLRLVCALSPPTDPLVGFAFLHAFIDVLTSYFGPNTSAATIRDNFDVVYELLAEALDAGHPLTTAPNALKDIVIPPSLLSSLLPTSTALPKPFSSPIPWRRAPPVRHSPNEIYFDVLESLDGVVSRSGHATKLITTGVLRANALLSGTPDCLLAFTNPDVITQPSFHPCVRLARWSANRSLSFVPPDGRFVLMDYELIAPPALPMTVKIHVSIEEGKAEITLTPRLSLESLLVSLPLGNVSGVRATGAPWSWDSQTRKLKWDIHSAPKNSRYVLNVTFTADKSVRPTHVLSTSFTVANVANGSTFSGLRVGKFSVSEEYTPYKGVRGHAEGKVEWRW
ncbi:clathrin adaptor mu subunit [Armillaria luteobubalina]|uniref:Clathrin adaptor mu subunit n=1 Tax=Armillaria luteobubalina TaxID=153913 RepID=A0AA39QBB9_9AGAR|nr:clathrin adaptor mu subunit [Armillaria luteobubalina]